MNNKAHHIKLNKKWLSVLLTICMVITLIPATVMADAGKAPLSFKLDDPVPVDTGNSTETTVYNDATQAALYLRSQMVNRNDNVVFLYDMEHETLSSQGLLETIYDTALAETGVGYEGDYIRSHIKSHRSSLNQTEEQKGTWQVTITFSFVYRSTAEQEAEVTAEINRVLGTMDLEGKTDYEKFVMIYDYIVHNITYDTKGLNDKDPLVYTAWAAAIRHKAVCQGYASLLYRMLWQAGVPNRFIGGRKVQNDPETAHAWNIVKINGVYYNVDATWDANEATFGTVDGLFDSQYLMTWRLVADDLAHFPDHYRDEEYTTSEFYSQYPMSSTNYPKPSVLGYALDLESSIALKFLVYVPDFIDEDSVYVDFDISDGGKSTVKSYSQDRINYGNNTYWYICHLNTLELADEVTATIHYGDGGDTVVNKITAQKYCQHILSRTDYSSEVRGMCEALLNLGYYMQQTDWKDDRGAHQPITRVSEITSTHKDDVKAIVSANYAFVRPSNSAYTRVAYSLTFNTQMSINVYYQLDPRYSSSDEIIKKNGEDWYTFSFTNLYPYWYDEMIGFCSDGKVSVLSYVNSVLKNTGDRFSSEKQYAMVALYDYYYASEQF